MKESLINPDNEKSNEEDSGDQKQREAEQELFRLAKDLKKKQEEENTGYVRYKKRKQKQK